MKSNSQNSALTALIKRAKVNQCQNKKNLSKILFACSLRKARRQNIHQSNPALLGRNTYDRIKEGNVPHFKGFMSACEKLGLEIRFKLCGPQAENLCLDKFCRLDNEFSRRKLERLMTAIYNSASARRADKEIRQYQLEKLKQISDVSGEIHWANLYRFFGACGYDLIVWIEDSAVEQL